MRQKIRELGYKAGAKIVTKKAVALDKACELKDNGSAEPIVIIAVLCIAVLLVIAGRPLLSNIMTALGGKAQTAVEQQF